jgi:hypothetical protein
VVLDIRGWGAQLESESLDFDCSIFGRADTVPKHCIGSICEAQWNSCL